MNVAYKLLAVASLAASSVFAQGFLGFGLSAGVKGGIPTTDPIQTIESASSSPSKTFSDSTGFIIGPTVELHLPLGLSVEGDGLYRQTNISTQSGSFLLPGSSSSDYNFWEVSVLGKYHLPTPIVKPYISVGPSFRTVDGLNSYFSTKGVTAAVGVEAKLLKLRIGPEVRYTHWGNDPSNAFNDLLRTKRNQVEILFGLTF